MTSLLNDVLLRVDRTVTYRIPRPLRRYLTQRFTGMYERMMDQFYGIDTLRDLARFSDVTDPDFSTSYYPTPWFTLQKALKALPISEEDGFLDAGCGKGRALLIAATFPFAKVLGVEIAEDLCHIARRNAETYFARLGQAARCESISVINANAERFSLPKEVTVMYMYNPFLGKSFDRVMRNVARSLSLYPRNFYLIYSNPRYASRLKQYFGMEEKLIPHFNRDFCRVFQIKKVQAWRAQRSTLVA